LLAVVVAVRPVVAVVVLAVNGHRTVQIRQAAAAQQNQH
jgi:hypothetical protein